MGCAFVVFVESIQKRNGLVIATAVNGSPEGPPSVTWELPIEEIENCHIGGKYRVSVEPVG